MGAGSGRRTGTGLKSIPRKAPGNSQRFVVGSGQLGARRLLEDYQVRVRSSSKRDRPAEALAHGQSYPCSAAFGKHQNNIAGLSALRQMIGRSAHIDASALPQQESEHTIPRLGVSCRLIMWFHQPHVHLEIQRGGFGTFDCIEGELRLRRRRGVAMHG